MMIKRVGFACKWTEVVGNKAIAVPELNNRTTTVAWLKRQPRDVAEQRLWDLMEHNTAAARALVVRVGSLHPELRMVRLGSDILPVYTEPTFGYFWQRREVRAYCKTVFAEIGRAARAMNVRLSFHPGQFCCIVSSSDDVVQRSLAELEYHTDMIRWMGYGRTFQDFKCNVHLSGRLGVDGFDRAWQQMSPELRNCLTLENDEYQANIDELIKLKDRVAIVLDIHHHLISNGEYITATDPRIPQIIDSWRGVRPVIHYSQSREEYLENHAERLPSFQLLTESVQRGKLRAHSNMYNHTPTNDWALTHWEWADMVAEAKCKNLASRALYEYAKQRNHNVG